MNEVNSGTVYSSNAVQNQLYKTEEIQTHILQMSELTKQVDHAGNDVATSLKSFHETTAQMNSISEQNQVIVTHIGSLVNELNLDADELKEYNN